MSAFRTADMPAGEAIRWLWLATHAAHDLWDDESWEALCDRHIASGQTRQTGLPVRIGEIANVKDKVRVVGDAVSICK